MAKLETAAPELQWLVRSVIIRVGERYPDEVVIRLSRGVVTTDIVTIEAPATEGVRGAQAHPTEQRAATPALSFMTPDSRRRRGRRAHP